MIPIKVRIMENNMNMNNGYGAGAPQFGYGQQSQVTPVNCNQAMHITTISDLQSYANGTIVRFPDFGDGQPFVARVRRPSLLVLAKQGKIPNSLLTAAGELFAKGGSGLDADWSITGFNWDQALEEAQSISVTAKITASERAPIFTVAGAGE